MKPVKNYFSYLKKIKKIPRLLGIAIFTVGLVFGIFAIKTSRLFTSQGSTEITPRQVKITNIGNSSYTVSWITQEKTAALVYYGEDSSFLGDIAKDVRDKESKNAQPHLTHYFTIENLKPNKKYYFQIFSNRKTYNNSGALYEVTTGPEKNPQDNDLANGKILKSDNQPASDTILYLSMANTFPQSSLTDSDGNWVIPLSTARTQDLQNFSDYDRKAQIMEIFVQGEKEIANATLTTSNDNPAPNITLGQNYNFVGEVPEGNSTSALTTSGLAADSSGSASLENYTLTITYPSENEKVNNQLPEFFGNGPKNQSLEVLIESDPIIVSQANADDRGKWKWSPTKTLTPGEHQITVSYTTNEGFIEKVSKKFTVLAVGESNLPAFTATESGKLTPTPTTPKPTTKPTNTPTPTKTPTPVPGVTTSPTTTPQETVTSAPTETPPTTVSTATPTTEKTRTTMPSTSSGTFKPGVSTPTIVFATLGAVSFLIGLVLVLF